jgi:cytochrome c5
MRLPRSTPPTHAIALVLAGFATVLAAPAAHASESKSGEAVYEQVCKACHATGEAGAPRFGDRAAWKPLIAEGQAMLFRASIRGIRKMPARGGRPDLADVEVKRAVVYMANAAGAKWTEPAR